MNDTNDKCPRCERSEFVLIDNEIKCPMCGLSKKTAVENRIRLDIAIFGNAFVMHKSDGTAEIIHPMDVTIKTRK